MLYLAFDQCICQTTKFESLVLDLALRSKSLEAAAAAVELNHHHHHQHCHHHQCLWFQTSFNAVHMLHHLESALFFVQILSNIG